MHTMRSPFISSTGIALAAAALVLSAACVGRDRSASSPARTGEATVQSLIGDAACRSSDQCSTVAVGAKACGGPAGYVAWSSLRTDGERLRALAEHDAQAQRKAMQARGEMSDCSVVVDPGAYCDLAQARDGLGVCRLQGGGRTRGPVVR